MFFAPLRFYILLVIPYQSLFILNLFKCGPIENQVRDWILVEDYFDQDVLQLLVVRLLKKAETETRFGKVFEAAWLVKANIRRRVSFLQLADLFEVIISL